jgi:hypothetical protein
MYKSPIVLLLLLLSTNLCIAQSKFTISGTVTDQKNGETIIGSSITIKGTNTGTVTNSYGFYSITLNEGSYKLIFSTVGYQSDTVNMELKANVTLNKSLTENSHKLTEVVISSRKSNDNLTKATMGTEVLNMKTAAKIPVVFGEKDLVKTIQLMPGIKSNGEGSNGFSVRGGATDQNLILLDEAPVYNASHLLGMFSTFNSDAIKDATIIKGNSPSEFGGRLSSVLDVKMKEGNNRGYQVSGGIGLISSRLTVEGPIQKEKSSFIISGRRTYVDLFAKLSSDFASTKLYFYDLNAKANIVINDKNKLFFSGYFGKDVLSVSQIFGSNWGNATGTLRWNSVLSSKLFSNTSFIYSDYDFNVGFNTGGVEINFNSHIKDLNLKQDFTYYLNTKNTLKFGFNAIEHTITPTSPSGTDITSIKNDRKGLESAVYASNSFSMSNKISVDYGVRLSSYTILGGDTYNIYQDHQITNSLQLAKGKFGKSYLNVEPRISFNYRLNNTSSAKFGYARNTQNLHLMSNSTGGSPTDQWIGNSYNIRPETADQISLGFSKTLKENTFELNTEIYYKKMQHQIDFRDGADINTVPDIESELLFGQGRAYGIELLLKKKTGRFSGWIGYTLSRTERQINGINEGAWYASKQDKTHDLSLVTIYELTPKWTLSGTFIYATGNAVTFPTGKYQLNGMQIYQYGKRNADRTPATHRFDISATYEKVTNKRYQSSWNFGLYNVYGRQNPFSISFKENKDNPQQIDAVQTSLFQWIPSVTYNFKF